MSLEPGGRSDKYGNEYENQYLARLFLRVVNGKAASVTVEPLDEFSDAMEYISELNDGSVDYYQCKSSNGSNKSWTVLNLKKNGILSHIKMLLLHNQHARYHFISPLPVNEMYELCKRARTSKSSEEFKTFSLTSEKVRRDYKDCIAAFCFDENDQEDITTLYSILSRCYFEQIPFTESATLELEDHLGLTFTGNTTSIRILLEHYTNGTGKYGVKITAKDIIDFLSLNNHQLRRGFYNNRAIQRIYELNHDYWVKSPGINGELLHRAAADEAIHAISNSSSVVLYGKAGAGKSSCLQEIINYLDSQGILYLSIKLDKFSPNRSSDMFGKDLGLSQSPIYELASLAGGKQCVLILDQLDTLRWTNRHSSTALEVCKEIITQTAAINRYQNGKLSIIVALRKFDLEYDAGLQRLFEEEDKKTAVLQWRKICVDIFDEEEVSRIIGSSYIGFSPRLKQLLRTPSSLFIWSRLSPDVQKSNIVSVKQLMDIWWKQIQTSCESAGIVQSELQICRNRIVCFMENRSTTVLSRHLFSDYSKIIDLLMSSGMLYSSLREVSFVHQSFLDYFISMNILEGVYSGKDIIELIEPYDNQTPNVRYRLLVVLNDLIETDQDTFVEQARKLLQSDAVHYYFKCCVFETIGQCDIPEKSVFALIDDYMNLSEWQDYIIQVVYFQHPVYVRHLATLSPNWVNDSNLSILKSIAGIEPELVMEILQPYADKSSDIDRKIYLTLPYDITDDTEKVFSFRLELLNRYPELLNSYYGLYDLIEKQSDRAIDLLSLLVENSSNQLYTQIFLDDDSKLIKYAQFHFLRIVEKLFPLICETTKDYLPTWSKQTFFPEYEKWTVSGLREGIFRRIVELTGYAMVELAKASSERFCKIIENIRYPFSGIGHEIIMRGIKELPLDYSDYCISWLLNEFHCKVFVFSSNESDYLKHSKEIVYKFSPYCSLPVFQKLEKAICSWKDDKKEILDILKYRLEAMRTDGRIPENYVYWGYFQKSILPFMPWGRLSSYARELLQVLNRNESIRLPHYYSGFPSGGFGSVISPIDAYTGKLSNKNWLSIIKAPPAKMKNHLYRGKHGSDYIEASHEMFASALGRQAQLEPIRFAKLSLAFPNACYSGYVLNALYALVNTEKSEETVPIDLLSEVIRKYQDNESRDIAQAITLIVHKNAIHNWPNDILSLLERYALSHPDPGPDEYSVTINDDDEHLSPRSLLNNAINCVRGNALRAIGQLIFHHHELGDRFRQVISEACNDCNDAVKFSVMFCLIPFSYIDFHFAEEQFKKLLTQDLRVISAPHSWRIVSETAQTDSGWCQTKISEALSSDIEEVADFAATLTCALAVFKRDECMMETIQKFPFNEKQREAMCRQAVSSFPNADHHALSEEVIRHLITTSSVELHSLGQLFYQQRIHIDRDLQFLTFLMQSFQGPKLLHAFLHYLKESDSDLCNFAEVFQAIGNGMAAEVDKTQRVFVMDDFIGCIIRLFDRGKDDQRIKSICLELWDKLFMYNLHGMKQISDIIEECE